MDSNIFSTVTTGQEKAKNKVKEFILQNLIFIVLIFNIVLEIVSKLYRIGFKNPFSVEFFLELSVSITTSMICYICFIPFGKSDEKKNNPSFFSNIDLWGELSDAVRNGFNNLFRLFCIEQLEIEREDKRRALIGNNTLISYEDYMEKYRGKSKKQINDLVLSGELSSNEAKAINQANGNSRINYVKVKPINPVIILSGVKKTQINDAGRVDSSYTISWLFSRPFVIFITNALINAITTYFIGSWQNAIFDMLLSVLMVILASACGYSAGVTSIRKENDKVKSRILFLSLFTEKHSIKMPIKVHNSAPKQAQISQKF